jgi:hypothetical protein
MLIVPYSHNVTTQNNISIHSIQILTVGGKMLWEEEQPDLDIHKDILNPNDIWCKDSIRTIEKKIKLCEVDCDKTNMKDFYKWSELKLSDTETFCWRNFTYLQGPKGEIWLNYPKNETLSKINLNKLISSIVSV